MKTIDVLLELIRQNVTFQATENGMLKVTDKDRILTVETYAYLKEKKAEVLALVGVHLRQVHCKGCKADFWHDAACGDAVGCPACFGHEVLSIETYPTELEALRAYPEWNAAREYVINLHASEAVN